MKELYVNDTLVDLHPNTVIAQTLQVFDPGRLGSVVTTYTNSVRVPRTFRNEQLFGHLSNSKTKSTVQYSSLLCRYVEDGLPIIRNARVIVTEVAEEYALNIYAGPWGFFEVIEKKTLWDLDFSDINGPWTEATRDGYRNATTGILQALVDDGLLASLSPPVIDYDGTFVRCPQIYYHTVLEKVFSSFGFEYTGDIFENDIYLKLAMPLSNAYKDPTFLNTKVFSVAANGEQIMVNPATETNVEFTENLKQGDDEFYDGVSEYVVVNPDTAGAYFKTRFQADLTIVVTGGTVDIKIEATGYSPTAEINKGSGTYSLLFTPTTGLGDADVVKVTIVANTGTPTVEIVSGVFYNYPITGVEDENDESYLPTITEDYVYFQKLFEEVNLLDWLREFCVRFNCQITQINNVLHVNTLNRILDDRSGPDWTTKRDKSTIDRIRWTFNSYGRTNILKTPIDNAYTPDITSVYGDGQFTIPNENLKEKLDVYTSIMKASQMITTFGVFMLDLNIRRINEISTVAELIRYPGNRLFLVREKYDHEPDVVYEATPRDDYFVGYWFDPNQEYELSWVMFIAEFHQKFVDRCLRAVRLIEREYNLSDLDIYKFNQQVPIWDNGERFLVTKIINRVSRRKVKVELLKIEPNPEHFFISGTSNDITGDLVDTMELVGDTELAQLSVEMEYIETVTGNPTWQCTWDNGSDSLITTVIGNGSSDADILDPHSGATDVDANVLKTNNDGDGPDGFPTATGWVEWQRNGIQEHTAVFDSSGHSNTFNLNYTYPDVSPIDTLTVIVHEDGTTP